MKTFVRRQSDNVLVMIEAPEKPNFKDSFFGEDYSRNTYQSAIKQAIEKGVPVADQDKAAIMMKISSKYGSPGVERETTYALDVEMEVRETGRSIDLGNGMVQLERLAFLVEPKTERLPPPSLIPKDQEEAFRLWIERGDITGDEARAMVSKPKKETKTQNDMEQHMEIKRALDAPANYSLQECLAELKSGRPAQNQIWLDEKIKELNGVDSLTEIREGLINFLSNTQGIEMPTPLAFDIINFMKSKGINFTTPAEPKQEGEVDKLIRSIHVDRANFEHIAKTGNINGTLLSELRRILTPAEPPVGTSASEQPTTVYTMTRDDKGNVEYFINGKKAESKGLLSTLDVRAEHPKVTPAEPKEEQKELLLAFKKWYDSLTPRDKCTVWPPADSSAGHGLYNQSDEDLIQKFIHRK